MGGFRPVGMAAYYLRLLHFVLIDPLIELAVITIHILLDGCTTIIHDKKTVDE